MAARRITQETFDAAVRENIEEFEMGPEEAVEEAAEQFESQGQAQDVRAMCGAVSPCHTWHRCQCLLSPGPLGNTPAQAQSDKREWSPAVGTGRGGAR